MSNRLVSRLAASTLALSMTVASVAAADGSDWNTDGSAGISKNEFRSGFGANRAFATWDADNSGTLSRAEIETGVGDRRDFRDRYGENWFEDWDANSDSAISEDEYYDGLYVSYDADGSNVIDDAEMGYVGDDMSDGGWFDVQ